MNKNIIDLNYALEARKSNVDSSIEYYNVSMGYILDLHIDLANLAKGLEVRNYLEKFILADLVGILNRIADICNFLEIDLTSDFRDVTGATTEEILNSLFNSVSMLNYKKVTARAKMKTRIIPLFVELVESLGFTLEELEDFYRKMQQN